MCADRMGSVTSSSRSSTSTMPDSSAETASTLNVIISILGQLPRGVAHIICGYAVRRASPILYHFGGNVVGNECVTALFLDTSNRTRAPIWQTLPDMPTPRSWCSAASIEHRVFVTGNTYASNNVDCYDTSTRTWSNFAPLNKLRHSHVIVSCDNVLYVLGGIAPPLTTIDTRVSSWVSGEMFDIQNNDGWREIPMMHRQRNAFCAAAYDGRIFIMGGVDATGRSLSTCERFDPSTRKWTLLSNMHIGRAFSKCVLIPSTRTVGECMIAVMGGAGPGYSPFAPLMCVEVYDVVADKWCQASWSLPTPILHFSAFWVDACEGRNSSDYETGGVLIGGGCPSDRAAHRNVYMLCSKQMGVLICDGCPSVHRSVNVLCSERIWRSLPPLPIP